MLTDREKAIIGFMATTRIMSDVEQNPKFSTQYKATLRARMMTYLQQHWFGNVHPTDVKTVFEEVPFLFNEMKTMLTDMILKDVKSQAGFGVDKPLGSLDADIHKNVVVFGAQENPKDDKNGS